MFKVNDLFHKNFVLSTRKKILEIRNTYSSYS